MRQKLRKLALLVSLLVFPVVLNYLSPYLIIDGAAQGVASGSALAFAGMFASSLFVGRLWCGWGCPGAGLQEACATVRSGPARGGLLNAIKWVICGPVDRPDRLGGGVRGRNPVRGFLPPDGHVHLGGQPVRVHHLLRRVFLFMGTSLAAGRRASCHYICWMAPFMILAGNSGTRRSGLPSA